MSKKEAPKKLNSRRSFIKETGLAAASIMIVPRHVLGGTGFVPPSDKLNIAGIGVGGKGRSDIASFAKSPNVNIVSLCDVDDRQVVKSRESFPNASYYQDFRKMLEKEGKNIDAVSVSTPDHSHAVAAYSAMQMGKHVWELYDLQEDPSEMNNLYGNPEYKVLQNQLHEKLEEVRVKYEDSEQLNKEHLNRYLKEKGLLE